MFSLVRRPGAVALLGTVALLGVTGCGGDDDDASATTANIQPSSYEVKEPATTTTLPAVVEPDAEGRSPIEQAYVVASRNDVPYNIAILFDVDLEELRKYNGWEETTFVGFPDVGGTVRIPPGAKFIDPSVTTTTAAVASDEAADAPSTPAGPCAAGTHEIEEGDYPVNVARKYDVTLEALLAANNWSIDGNGNVPAWPGVGQSITIPAGDNCDTTTTVAG